jgi:hypothetical protein
MVIAVCSNSCGDIALSDPYDARWVPGVPNDINPFGRYVGKIYVRQRTPVV